MRTVWALLLVVALVGPPAAAAEADGRTAFLRTRADVPTHPEADHTLRYKLRLADVDRNERSAFRHIVAGTLHDERGWSAGGAVVFDEVRSNADFTLWLASPAEVAAADPACSRHYSCRVGDDVYINALRWREGADSYRDLGVQNYRRYVVNHEVGHWLSLDHRGCADPGAPASVMQQQSKGLGGCEAQVWPLAAEQERALDHLRAID